MLTPDALLSKLAQGDEAEQRSAAIALGDMGDASVVPMLVSLLERVTSGRVRDGIAIALYELGDERAKDALIRTILRLRADGASYDTLVWALGPSDAREAVVLLAEIICHDSYVDALMAIGVIERFKGSVPEIDRNRAVEILEGCLDQGTDPEGEERGDMARYAIEILTKDWPAPSTNAEVGES